MMALDKSIVVAIPQINLSMTKGDFCLFEIKTLCKVNLTYNALIAILQM